MQKFVLKNKNLISIISLILIVIAFTGHYGFHTNEMIIFEIKVFDKIIQTTFSDLPLIIASIIGVLPISIQAYQALKVKVVSIDVLVTIAVIGAFFIRNYEESAIVTFLFLFGAYLEQRTLNKTRSAIKELTEMAPESALKLMTHGSFEEVEVDQVLINDTLLVKTGARVPVDGTVIFGEGYINEASITGESLPVSKNIGSFVYAGTILENGTLQIKTEKVGEDTTFGKIIELVEDAQDSKSEAERFIDKFSTWYTPTVLIIGIIVGLITKNIELAITILVLGCPGALVIGVPVSNVAGIGNGARHGILLKGSEVIHDFSKVDSIIFDKTGTLTIGNPEVSKEIKYSNNTKILSYISSIERESNHPLGKAIINYIGDVELYRVTETDVVKGSGIVATVDNYRVAIGNVKLMKNQQVILNQQVYEDIKELELKGNSIVLTSIDGQLVNIMGIKDQIRLGVKTTLTKLKKLGIKNLIVLSGDNQGTVNQVAEELGFSEAHGNMLPEDKSNYVKELQSKGQKVAFVGDGVNDAPSLACADIGISMGAGTDVAIETSDVVLMNSDITKLPHALGLTKATFRNMKQNIIIAIGIVLVLLLSLLFSKWMNMSIGMLVHEGSILLVILNGMRLLRYKFEK